MLGRALLGAVVGAVILMVWGFVYWTVLPFGHVVMQGVGEESRVAESLARDLPGTGVYLIPWMEAGTAGEPEAMEDWVERHRRGPIAQVYYRAEGAEPMAPSVFLGGFVNMFTAALIVAVVLLLTAGSLPTYTQRVQLVFLVGLFAGVAEDLSRPIWWYQPWDYWIHQALFPVTGWLLVGLAMAAIVRRPEPTDLVSPNG